MNESTLTDFDYPFSFLYSFDKNLSSERYEYIYGYKFPTSPEYNYNANLAVVLAINSTFEKYQPGAEETLAKAFDTQIQKTGFKPVDGQPKWFINDEGMAVALNYEKGNVTVMCSYIPKYIAHLKVERKSREDFSKDNIQVDYVEHVSEVDSIAIDDVIE